MTRGAVVHLRKGAVVTTRGRSGPCAEGHGSAGLVHVEVVGSVHCRRQQRVRRYGELEVRDGAIRTIVGGVHIEHIEGEAWDDGIDKAPPSRDEPTVASEVDAGGLHGVGPDFEGDWVADILPLWKAQPNTLFAVVPAVRGGAYRGIARLQPLTEVVLEVDDQHEGLCVTGRREACGVAQPWNVCGDVRHRGVGILPRIPVAIDISNRALSHDTEVRRVSGLVVREVHLPDVETASILKVMGVIQGERVGG